MNIKTPVLTMCAALAAVAGAHAAEHAPKDVDRATMTQKHERMAEMHRKAAECLKSDKPVKECHDAMMKEAPAGGFHGEGCEMGGHGKGVRIKEKGVRRDGPGTAPEAEPQKDVKPN